jgi:Calcium binding
MTREAKDEAREQRIEMEIIVDAYGPEEQALGWYYYLEENLHVPFSARCVVRRAISPLQPGDKVEVVSLPFL